MNDEKTRPGRFSRTRSNQTSMQYPAFHSTDAVSCKHSRDSSNEQEIEEGEESKKNPRKE